MRTWSTDKVSYGLSRRKSSSFFEVRVWFSKMLRKFQWRDLEWRDVKSYESFVVWSNASIECEPHSNKRTTLDYWKHSITTHSLFESRQSRVLQVTSRAYGAHLSRCFTRTNRCLLLWSHSQKRVYSGPLFEWAQNRSRRRYVFVDHKRSPRFQRTPVEFVGLRSAVYDIRRKRRWAMQVKKKRQGPRTTTPTAYNPAVQVQLHHFDAPLAGSDTLVYNSTATVNNYTHAILEAARSCCSVQWLRLCSNRFWRKDPDVAAQRRRFLPLNFDAETCRLPFVTALSPPHSVHTDNWMKFNFFFNLYPDFSIFPGVWTIPPSRDLDRQSYFKLTQSKDNDFSLISLHMT